MLAGPGCFAGSAVARFRQAKWVCVGGPNANWVLVVMLFSCSLFNPDIVQSIRMADIILTEIFYVTST